MRTFRFFSALLSVVAVSTQFASPQVATGIQPLGSYGGGPEAVNLANANAHWDIPLLSKAGRGLNFSFALGYDSSVWVPDPTVNAWAPIVNWGWTAETQTQTGYVTSKTNIWKCFSGNSWYWATTYYDWTYFDRRGTPHGFNLNTISNCPTFPSSQTGTAIDASGYQITAYTGYAVVQDKSGHTLNPPYSTGTGPGTAEDDNGNEISYNGTTTFTDTLGYTVLTKSGTNPVVYTYTGPSGTQPQYSISYVSHTVKTNFGCSGVAEWGPSSVSLVDKITLPDNSYYQFTYEATPGYSGDVTGRIASVKLPTGGTISYSYSAGKNGITCADGSTATLTRTTPDGTWTYAHTESGTAWTTVVTDPKSDTTTLNFQDVYLNTATEVIRGEYETERQVNDVSLGLLQTVVTCYNGNISANCNSTAVSFPILRKTVFPQLPGSSNLESEIDTTFNNFGLPTKVDAYDYGTGGKPGPLLRETQTSYASLANDIQDHPAQISVYDGATHLMTQTTYTYDQGTVTTTSGTPQHGSVTGSRGNLTTLSALTSGTNTLTKTFTYFDTGNVYQATDTNSAVTTYTYGACGNSFPTQVSLPLSLSTSAVWDCNGGVTTSTTDANSQITQISYGSDPFWRPITLTDSENNVTTNTYTITTRESVLNFSSSTVDVLSTLDSLGRTKLVQKRQGRGVTNFDTVQDSYDSNGRLYSVTQPCVAMSGNGCGSGPATTTSYDALNRRETVTDAGTGTPGTLTYTYANNDVMQDLGPPTNGENDKKKQLQYDALGRLTSVCEITSAGGSGPCSQNTSATGFYTAYTYDALGNMTGSTQGAQTRSWLYDGLSRMTSETNPESGTTTYAYDSATGTTCSNSTGDLIKKTDANGNWICQDYDALHRVTDIGNSSQGRTNPCRRFRYDNTTGVLGSIPSGVTVTYPLGRIAEAETDDCSAWPVTQASMITDEWSSYSKLGRLTDSYESTPHSGGYYHAAVTYWPNGALNTLGGVGHQSTYTYGLDGEGRLYSAAQGSTNYVSGTTYNAAGEPLTVSLSNGNGDNDTYQYDSVGRMTNYTFTIGSPAKSMAGIVGWNSNGTVKSLTITDGFNSGGTQTCKYGDPNAVPPVAGYDDLRRLISANCSPNSIWAQAFSFDQFGNITKSGTISWTPGYNQSTNQYTTPANCQSNGGTPCYDADGNLLRDTFHQYSWNIYGTPATIDSTTCGSNGTCLTYDALGRMVEKNVAGTYSEIEYSPVGKVAVMNGTTQLQAYVPLPGGEMLSPGPDTFWHADWLGSVRLASSASNRTITFDRAFAPYGEMYNNVTGGTTQANFTGLTRDTISDEHDTAAREQHPVQGRWISPDPAGMAAVNPADPQTWNRYSYVRNGPLTATDPTGQMMEAPLFPKDGGYSMLGVYIGIGSTPGSPFDLNMNGFPIDPWAYAQAMAAMASSPASTNPLAQLMNNINGVLMAPFAPALQAAPWNYWDFIVGLEGSMDPTTYTIYSLGQMSGSDRTAFKQANYWAYEVIDQTDGTTALNVDVLEHLLQLVTPVMPDNLPEPQPNDYPAADGRFPDATGFYSNTPLTGDGAMMTLQWFDVTHDGTTYQNVGPINILVVTMQNGTLTTGQPVTVFTAQPHP